MTTKTTVGRSKTPKPRMANTDGPHTLKYTMYTKNVLTPDEAELYELSNLAGVVMDVKVFKIVVDLLRLNVAPTAIERMLKSMTVQKRKPHLQGANDLSLSSSSVSGLSASKGRQISGIRKPTYR